MSNVRTIDYSTNLTQSILWQYDNATRLVSLVNSKQTWYDVNQSAFFEQWFNDVFWLFNPKGLSTFGAAVWSIILRIPLQVGIPPDEPGAKIWAFDNPENFDQGAFTSGGSAVRLDIDDQLLLLRLRYYQLVTNGCLGSLPDCVPGVLDFVRYVFSMYPKYTGTIGILDHYDMSITYVFSQALPRALSFILDNYDILPRPAGVELNTLISSLPIFSLDNPENFDQGAFVYG